MKLPIRPREAASDEQLVEDVATGDGGAFAEIYARHAGRVYARLARLLGPGPDCEDVLQLVFTALHRALPQFRGQAQLATFIYRITANVATDHLRARARRSGEHDEAALEGLVDDGLTPERRACQLAELRQIFALLDEIEPDKRIAFVLVAVEGLSLGEAAEQVGVNVDTVKQRVRRARRELMTMMDDAERRLGRRSA